jgi:hypothetical protein
MGCEGSYYVGEFPSIKNKFIIKPLPALQGGVFLFDLALIRIDIYRDKPVSEGASWA